ncbi:hypothetical protein [Microbacterium alcoholitolerans]|uniref:hypothetical protein n=1 Tax=unclassified Microbacterium TaxID=2609290 RepID=UPI003D17F7AF
MSDEVFYSAAAADLLVPRWTTQASQMRTATNQLASASVSGLPPVARGAARSFLDLWERTARTASVAADVYGDEISATGASYGNLDAEIARRMAVLGSEMP